MYGLGDTIQELEADNKKLTLENAGLKFENEKYKQTIEVLTLKLNRLVMNIRKLNSEVLET